MKDVFVIVTLIDITETNVIRGEGKQRDQQRNWETVLQVLGLKTQPIILDGPIKVTEIDLEKNTCFGDFYKNFPGPHTIWGFKVSSELDDIYNIEDLKNDFEQVPIILGLEETVKFMLPIFHSRGELKNIQWL